MECHGEVDLEKASGHHRDPGREIAVVHVDVLHAKRLKQECVISAEPGVQDRLRAPQPGFRACSEDRVRQAG